jgi:hypothetical protein
METIKMSVRAVARGKIFTEKSVKMVLDMAFLRFLKGESGGFDPLSSARQIRLEPYPLTR